MCLYAYNKFKFVLLVDLVEFFFQLMFYFISSKDCFCMVSVLVILF